MSLGSGARLGPYEILGLLGAGGMGEVYRAHDSRLDRDVALKVLPDAVAADADRLARFEREAKALARIEHPNILTIHEFGHDAPAGGSRPRDALRGHGTPDRRDALGAAGARAPLVAAGGRDRRGGGGWPGGRARPGDRAPRPQAGQPLPDRRRPREDPGLRPGDERAVRRRSDAPRRRRVACRRDGARDGAGHGGLHGARAGAGDGGGRAGGPVRAGLRALRDGDRAAGVCAGDADRDARRRFCRRRLPEIVGERDGRAARTWRASSRAAWRSSRARASSRRRPGVRAARAADARRPACASPGDRCRAAASSLHRRAALRESELRSRAASTSATA